MSGVVLGTPEAEAQRSTLLGRVNDIETVLAAEFSTEPFAQRRAAAWSALDVLKTAIDALYQGDSIGQTAWQALGVKAAAETRGDDVEDANVAPRGDYEPPTGPDLPEYADASRTVPLGNTGIAGNPPELAAPDNLPTDPKARKGDQTTGTGGSGAGKTE